MNIGIIILIIVILLVLWLISAYNGLVSLRNKVKDSTRISIAIITYVLIRMLILEQIYYKYHAFADLKMTILYLTLIIICTTIIIKNKKEKAKEECLNKE